jgi:hypothetical protein
VVPKLDDSRPTTSRPESAQLARCWRKQADYLAQTQHFGHIMRSEMRKCKDNHSGKSIAASSKFSTQKTLKHNPGLKKKKQAKKRLLARDLPNLTPQQ